MKTATIMILLQDFFSPEGTFYHTIGLIASIGLVLGYVPQAIQTIKTRKTDDIALPTFLMIGIGGIAFMMQGAMLGILGDGDSFFGPGAALFITNLISTVCSVIIFGIKMIESLMNKYK